MGDVPFPKILSFSRSFLMKCFKSKCSAAFAIISPFLINIYSHNKRLLRPTLGWEPQTEGRVAGSLNGSQAWTVLGREGGTSG